MNNSVIYISVSDLSQVDIDTNELYMTYFETESLFEAFHVNV